MAKFFKNPKAILPVLVLVAISLFFFSSKLSDTADKVSSVSKAGNFQLFPTKAPPETMSEVHSADGEKKVVMKKVGNTDSNLSTYTFTASDINGGNGKTIYTTTLSENQNMEIPANSWSPDNKYLFLKEADGQSEAFFVFKASGETFSDGNTYIDVGPLFVAKKIEYKLDEITGWDDNTLLHVFTVSEKGRGPSYWFDIDSRNFLMLSSR